ncbi:hypothetical protein QEN19_002463 [Hanseniaspora menglaensis]
MVTGILKNINGNDEQESFSKQHEHPHINQSSTKEDLHKFRQQVYENTLLNAQLVDSKNHAGIRRLSGSSESEELEGNTEDGRHFKIPKDVLQMRLEQEGKYTSPTTPTKNERDENIVWNSQNLAENEILKQKYQDIHVDEPKTPYQGAIDLQGEYYNVDDDEEDGLEGFSLGNPSIAQTDIDDIDMDAEEKFETDEGSKSKKSFADMRKQHYNLGNVLKQGKDLLNEDDE